MVTPPQAEGVALTGQELAPLERVTPLGCRTVLGSYGPDDRLLSLQFPGFCIQLRLFPLISQVVSAGVYDVA